MARKCLHIIFLLILASSLSGRNLADFAFPDFLSPEQLPDSRCYQRVSDTLGQLWLTHSNRMIIGRPFQTHEVIPDDQEIIDRLPFQFNAVYPAHSRHEYLFAGGLWIGGIKGGDTLVASAYDDMAPIPDLLPTGCPEGAILLSSGMGDREYLFTASDTAVLFDTLFWCQFGDCRGWKPLGIRATARSYYWVSPPYNDLIITEYAITNIDSLPLTDGWIGFYIDADVGADRDNTGGDDISGFVEGLVDEQGQWKELNLAYSMDMDGDPASGNFNASSTRGAFGIQILGLDIPDPRVNFNWWVLDPDMNTATAPRRNEADVRDLGYMQDIPLGDRNKYYVLSHDERDYNQVEAGLAHAGFLPPNQSLKRAAKGLDTRFLVSTGPFNLEPADSVTFTIAFLAADNVIGNPFINAWFVPDNYVSVSDYYELADYSPLLEKAWLAKNVYDSRFALPPPAPPTDFAITAYNDSLVSLVWSKSTARDAAGYLVYERGGGGEWNIAARIYSPNDTTYDFPAGDPMVGYSFAVAAVDSTGGAGAWSDSLTVFPGAPASPATISGSSDLGYPVLVWSSVMGEGVRYRLYRRLAEGSTFAAITETEDTIYIDFLAAQGKTYCYYVLAVDHQGLESIPSPSLYLTPLMMTSGILVINQNSEDLFSNFAFDDVLFDSLIYRALDGLAYTRRKVTSVNPLTMPELSQYGLVIISAENRSGSLTQATTDVLTEYLNNGGNAIIILRHAAVNECSWTDPRIIHYEPESIFRKMFHLDSGYIGPTEVLPGPILNGDCLGATAVAGRFPSLVWDSIRANQFSYAVPYGLPYCGYFWPDSLAEILYTYRSSPGGPSDGQVTGIKYLDNRYGVFLLNFPLSLMVGDSAAAVLRGMVDEARGGFICGDINRDFRVNLGDIVSYVRYLYFSEHPADMALAGDVDCNGEYSLLDLMVLINFYLNEGLAPACCPQEAEER